MKLTHSLSALSLAIAAALPLGWSGAALAAGTSSPAITSMGVEQVRSLAPGEVLSFTLDGTPGAMVTLQITGATAPVTMAETRPGHYEGEYTVRRGDRLTAASQVSSRVVKDGRMSSATLSQALLFGAPSPVTLPMVQISDFDVNAPERVRPGDELDFRLVGTAGGKATVAIAGLARPIALREVSRGVYEGSYVVRRQDRLRGQLVADATLLSDRRQATQRYLSGGEGRRGDERDLGDNDARERGDNAGAGPRAMVASCTGCGTVTAVERVEVDGRSANVLGTVAGGVIGGVLGNQVGGGTGKDLATIIGAVGGAYAGNRIQNDRDKVKVYRVSVRLDGGITVQTFDYADDPEVKAGARVKIDNGQLVRL